MVFESTHIKGKGRGKPMGFPTINLRQPANFELKDGIYAAKVVIENRTYVGALHYGPIPTFGDPEKNLEVFLINVPNNAVVIDSLENLGEKKIKVKIIKFLRKVIKFRSVSSLVMQISHDVDKIKKLLI